MPYPTEHSARVKDPELFDPTSFRSKDLGSGVRIILGKLKGQSSMTVQAYRFSVDKFTVEGAKKWLEDHKVTYMKFEPAKKEELKHVGVLGMRWGKRKGQSSTSSDHEKAVSIKKKKVKEMTNDDLKFITGRMQLEKQYKDLNPSKVSRGKKRVSAALASIGKVSVAATTLVTLIGAGTKLYNYYKEAHAKGLV